MDNIIDTVRDKLNIVSVDESNPSDSSSEQSGDDADPEEIKGRTILKAKRRLPQTQPNIISEPKTKRQKVEKQAVPKKTRAASKAKASDNEDMSEE